MTEAAAQEQNVERPVSLAALFTAFLTAFYMLRLVVVVFFGKPRSDQARAGREAPWVMLIPLIILAIAAFASGFGFVAKLFHFFLALVWRR